MPSGRTMLSRHSRGKRNVQKVQLVKPKRKRTGPKITRLLKTKTTASLRYVDTITIDAGSAAIAAHAFRANGVFDPDFTSTGHQPLMYDEYTPLYSFYRVLSSKIKVTAVTSTTSNQVPGLFGVYLDDDSSLSYTKGTSIIEDKRNRGSWKIGGQGSTYRNSKAETTVSYSFNAKRFLGISPSNVQHPIDQNPGTSTDAFFQIWSSSISGNNPGLQTFIVQIDYVVEFTGPKHVTES